MRYRQPLLDQAGSISDEHWQLLSQAQLARLAQWSIVKGQPVLTLLTEARFMLEDEGQGTTVLLEGYLPHCGLYGAMLSDGSTHT